MLTERNVWFGATTALIGILLLIVVRTPFERRGGLPGIPVHSIVVDPDDRQRLYLDTDLGVMVSIDGGRTWMTEGVGAGSAVTMRLSLISTPAGQKQLFAFTHDSGAWRVALR